MEDETKPETPRLMQDQIAAWEKRMERRRREEELEEEMRRKRERPPTNNIRPAIAPHDSVPGERR